MAPFFIKEREMNRATPIRNISKFYSTVALFAEMGHAPKRQILYITSPLAIIGKECKSISEMRSMPIITAADTACRDADKTDVNKLQIEQRAYVVADAYGDWGRVVRIEMLGKKIIRTDEPTERVDTKILETLVELGGDSMLPTRLRVDAMIEVGK